jgi:hypothetical protein
MKQASSLVEEMWQIPSGSEVVSVEPSRISSSLRSQKSTEWLVPQSKYWKTSVLMASNYE